MDREEAQRRSQAHERIARKADTSPAKRQQHLEAARYLREKHGIPEPVVIKAIPPGPLTENFEQLRARLDPHVASKPDWKSKV